MSDLCVINSLYLPPILADVSIPLYWLPDRSLSVIFASEILEISCAFTLVAVSVMSFVGTSDCPHGVLLRILELISMSIICAFCNLLSIDVLSNCYTLLCLRNLSDVVMVFGDRSDAGDLIDSILLPVVSYLLVWSWFFTSSSIYT